jgi:chromate transporter
MCSTPQWYHRSVLGPAETASVPAPDAAPVPFALALRVWAKIGLLSFGGPAGQIALMHKELVERRRWIDEASFLHALNYCMLLPGPEAQQLAIYIGWLMHKTRGGLAAGILFVLPGFVTILGLSLMYAGLRQSPAVSALFFGLKAAVLAVVVEAVVRLGKRALKSPLMVLVAMLSFVALFFAMIPFPLVIITGAGFGFFASRLRPGAFPAPTPAAGSLSSFTVIGQMAAAGALSHTRPSAARALRVMLICVLLWTLPLIALAAVFGSASVFVQEGLFFSSAAMVTFGGAYAVLAYIAQRAVETYGWLGPGEMLDGLGLAETTPGPLVLVVQFVAFMGAFHAPGDLPPMVAGVLGAMVAVWVTFVPCFLWIFLGAPYIEAVRGNRALHAALSTITAAVVGVILNLSLWFSLHVLFREVHEHHVGGLRLLSPELASVDPAAAVLAALALIALLHFRLGVARTLGSIAVLGACYQLFLQAAG